MGKKMTTEEFIAKAKEVHGDKYDYSKVEYINNNTEVIIICKECGTEFRQRPYVHIGLKCGCKHCNNAKSKRNPIEIFIKKSKEKFGDKYDYTDCHYIGSSNNVYIKCKKHGGFVINAQSHLQGNICPKCKEEKAITTESFIERAKKVHGDKYDYSKTNYINSNTKIIVICKEHGEFETWPLAHLKGVGCPKCAGKKITTEDFIKKAKEIHGDKYDYSKVVYKGNREKVCIICPEHGEFWQSASDHLHGCGCRKCHQKNAYMTFDEFLQKAQQIHGDKYDYSKINWETITNKQKDLIEIVCPVHGTFKQTPYVHLLGCGCPNCNGFRKKYKFNLLEEFISEYEFRTFLENNDQNILLIIIRNLEPKYEPIKKDLEKALARTKETDPIKALRDKYMSDDEEQDVNDETENTGEENIHDINTIDMDDDDAFKAVMTEITESSKESEEEDGEKEEKELSIDDVVKNDETELKVINKIEHMLTPEDRQYIMDKFLNDRRRQWMAEREKKSCNN